MSSLPIRRLLNQSVTVSHYVMGDNTFDHESYYSAPITVPARVEFAPARTFGLNGEDITSYAVVYVETEVYPKDKLTLPDGTIRTVLSASRQHDGMGKFSHTEVRI